MFRTRLTKRGNSINKVLIVFLLVSLLSVASCYICIEKNDSDTVKDFKTKINLLILKNDIEKNNITEKSLEYKIKYFNPCIK